MDSTTQSEDGTFYGYMKGRWHRVRSASQGAEVSLENTGDGHTAIMQCAIRLRDVLKVT